MCGPAAGPWGSDSALRAKLRSLKSSELHWFPHLWKRYSYRVLSGQTAAATERRVWLDLWIRTFPWAQPHENKGLSTCFPLPSFIQSTRGTIGEHMQNKWMSTQQKNSIWISPLLLFSLPLKTTPRQYLPLSYTTNTCYCCHYYFNFEIALAKLHRLTSNLTCCFSLPTGWVTGMCWH